MLRVETSWPFSGDYALANKLIDERERAWEAERGALLQSLENVQRDVSAKMKRAKHCAISWPLFTPNVR